MHRTIAIACLALGLTGCAGGGSAADLLDAIGRNYGHCERHITYSAGVGVLSPGATISGSIDCPPEAGTAPARSGAAEPRA